MLNTNEFVIYGYGNLGKKVHKMLIENGKTEITICDNNTINAINFSETAIIVISVWNPYVDLSVLFKSLKNKYPRNEVVFAGELTNYFKFEHFCFASREFINQNLDEIKRTRELLTDKRSKELFDELIQLRRANNFDQYLKIDTNQYFPIDIPELTSQLQDCVFCDIGAFDGDTLVNLNKTVSKFKYIGFEPDKTNFDNLVVKLHSIEADGYAVNKCTGKKNGFVLFENGNGVSSKIVNEQDETDYACLETEMVCLDHFDWGYLGVPNVFKMDIEGAEFETISGMEQLIKEKKPVLMICLYHTKEDLWRIPNLISEWNANYRLSIRQHAPNGLETVLYCY